ncbi:hypothetical protein SLEP1_g48594 [Rubroshorea leprosula]|uniref:Glycosyltransferase n=1 Tax=Rubroshorea leprosula TaxID=152421 RepID=A0AAV5LW72_9ROSI|nr:hypothetical protein SLEP1_g48594 [Rubroshorea leprosula]
MVGFSSDEHIVMLPMMAHGHLVPFLALAREIHQRKGFTITMASTPLNIQYLRSTAVSEIRLVELPFRSAEHGLPPDTENTENLPLDQLINIFRASESLEAPVRQLLSEIVEKEGRPPLCVVSDVFFGWAVRVAESMGTVNVTFATWGAYGNLAFISLWMNLPHRESESEEFTLPGLPDRIRFPISPLHQFLRMANGTDSWSRFFQPQISKSLRSLGCLCNTVEEVEPIALEWLRNYMKIPVWPIGPLLPSALLNKSSSSAGHFYKHRAGKQPGMSVEKCIKWLDLQKPDSVLYISFGSQNTISQAQMKALASGLEESGVLFIWVIRPPLGFDLRGEFKPEWLPDGFEERTREKKQGLLVKNWAPQLDILSHKSTGAFLSHCGWNSVTESLSQGVPIIGWPMAAEQAYNSKMLVEEMGVSVELTRGLQSEIRGEEVKEMIETVMGENGKGAEMRKKAAEVAERIKAAMNEEGEEKGSSIQALDNFISAVSVRGKQKEICT